MIIGHFLKQKKKEERIRRIIRDIRTLFDTKKEKEGGKKRNKTKK